MAVCDVPGSDPGTSDLAKAEMANEGANHGPASTSRTPRRRVSRSDCARELSSETFAARSGVVCAALDPRRVGAEEQREVVPADVVGAAEVQDAADVAARRARGAPSARSPTATGERISSTKKRVPSRAQPLLRPGPRAPVEERRADDQRLRMRHPHGELGRGLRAAVVVDRVRRIRLDVPPAIAAEDDVGGEVDEARPAPRPRATTSEPSTLFDHGSSFWRYAVWTTTSQPRRRARHRVGVAHVHAYPLHVGAGGSRVAHVARTAQSPRAPAGRPPRRGTRRRR